MKATLLRAAVLTGIFSSLGANHRTQNFLVTAADEKFAVQVCEAAEVFRRDLAIEWLGHELPDWRSPCPIRVRTAPGLGAGGATSFMFRRGKPFNWTMDIQGSRQRIMDSVLPHEVTHTIFATHFGGPLPRWADEGACTTVEHVSERKKQERMLIEFLTHNRGIAFNNMFAMKDYPQDIMPLYSQGYSLARFLIAQGGKPKFVQYVGDGMESNNWPAATAKHYGFKDLSELQLTWVDWVGKGSPPLKPRAEAFASAASGGGVFVASAKGRQPSGSDLLPVKPPARSAASLQSSEQVMAKPSWYAIQRDRKDVARTQSVTRPQGIQRTQQTNLD